MGRFALRHWTAILVAAVVAWWAVFYMPNTPSFAVLELKQAIDNRDGEAAARYINFESVVRKAGYEMVEKKEGGSALGQMLGKGAVDVFAKPVAQLAKAWATKQVNDGARDVQMPPGAVFGALILLHRNGDSAYTRFRDARGREWQVQMARNSAGVWQVTEVRNIGQLLDTLKREEENKSGG
jgi:Protein of unknown function (DUF2939)